MVPFQRLFDGAVYVAWMLILYWVLIIWWKFQLGTPS